MAQTLDQDVVVGIFFSFFFSCCDFFASTSVTSFVSDKSCVIVSRKVGVGFVTSVRVGLMCCFICHRVPDVFGP